MYMGCLQSALNWCEDIWMAFDLDDLLVARGSRRVNSVGLNWPTACGLEKGISQDTRITE